jgi:hypothetical protein
MSILPAAKWSSRLNTTDEKWLLDLIGQGISVHSGPFSSEPSAKQGVRLGSWNVGTIAIPSRSLLVLRIARAEDELCRLNGQIHY